MGGRATRSSEMNLCGFSWGKAPWRKRRAHVAGLFGSYTSESESLDYGSSDEFETEH